VEHRSRIRRGKAAVAGPAFRRCSCGLPLAIFFFGSVCVPRGAAAEVRIGVFGLFAPNELRLQAEDSQILRVTASNGEARIEGGQTAECRAANSRVECTVAGRSLEGAAVEVAGERAAASFRVAVPGKIDRRFAGRLQLTAAGRTLRATVVMDEETAVGSIVAAESPPDAALEALKAQAVAARSYLSAGARHEGFDFCDTTHCQYLREPPPDGHPAHRATASTEGLVVTHEGTVVRALYSGSCGGTTQTLREAGLPSEGYPFFSVSCDSCRREPETWQATFAREVIQPILERPTEAMRLAFVRRQGWGALPSTRFRVEAHGDLVTLYGTGKGHGIGLCQRGAASLAAGGADFRAILRRYFPNTRLGSEAGGEGDGGEGDSHPTAAF
jgi:stage II sporulation protein D